MSDEAIWHDVENAGYEADLELWRELAAEEAGPILDLGCGSGRVAIDLADRGHCVCAVDRSDRVLEALRRRAREHRVEVERVEADVCRLDLGHRRFGLALAPMQLLQMLDGRESRVELLRRAGAALLPGGLLAAAIVDGVPPETWDERDGAPLPDVRERDGWVYSSVPVAVRSDDEQMVIERLRQTVAPGGDLSETTDRVELSILDAARLESEALEAGLEPAGRRQIAATDMHTPCVAVLLRSGEEN